jgi:MFS family permease
VTSRTYAAYALGLLTLINVLNYTDRNVVFALFEPIKAELQLTDTELGWLGSAYIIVLSLMALPLGVIGDLRSRRGVITFGVTLWSLATAAGGFVSRFWQLFTCRALVGVGEAGYMPASQGIIADYYPGKTRALAMGIYSVGMALGGVLGIWIGGELSLAFGWRNAFILMGLPGIALALLASQLHEPNRRPPEPLRAAVASWYRHRLPGALRIARPLIILTAIGGVVGSILTVTERAPSEVDVAVFAALTAIGLTWTVMRLVPVAFARTAGVAATAVEEFVEAGAIVLRTPTLMWIFVGGALVTFCVNGLIAWAPSFLQRAHGMNPVEVGRTFGVLGLAGGVLGALAGGRLADALQARWVGGRVFAAGVGFVLGGPICTALLLVDRSALFTALMIGTFFFYTWYNGPISAVIIDVVPAAVRSTVIGAFVLFSHLLGDAIAPPLVGYLSDRSDLRTAMLVLPATGVLGGLVILVAVATVGRDIRRRRVADTGEYRAVR